MTAEERTRILRTSVTESVVRARIVSALLETVAQGHPAEDFAPLRFAVNDLEGALDRGRDACDDADDTID